MASIKLLGKLQQNTSPESWTGKISVASQDRTDADTILEQLVSALDNYYVEVPADTYIRCVDGRPSNGIIQNLGAQIPGGTVLDAVAYHLAARTLHSLGEDMSIVIAQTISQNFNPGGHTDDHADGSKTGCGAIDGIDKILEIIGNPARKADLKSLTKSLMGDIYDEQLFFDAVSAAAELAGNQHYLEGRKPVLEALEEDKPNSVEQLTGVHNECIAAINYVSCTTFDRDNFVKHTKNSIHAFNYDVWFTIEFAHSLPLPRDVQELFIHIRILIGIATFMQLTDGSLKLVIRS